MDASSPRARCGVEGNARDFSEWVWFGLTHSTERRTLIAHRIAGIKPGQRDRGLQYMKG